MQNLQNELVELLINEDNLVIDGHLNKNKIVELALKVEPQLISILVKSETFKKHFFQEVESVLVFDKIKFQRFVNNKSFLPDSYTAFKNKIGLITNDDDLDNYISSSNNVVLAWPHKDCVLEGGQTKEDQKRNEIFWNETLAPDSIDRLLDAKVFTNFKMFDKNGEHDLTQINGNEHLIIKGNNLLTISSLVKTHRNRVKLVYIDPPYNTAGEANTFAYNNTFNHSTWLTFMRNRLEVSRKLLKEDGILCVAIDDVEQAYLKVLCDEIFGRNNFIGNVIVQIKKEGRTDNEFFATSHDYAMFYAKDITKAKIFDIDINEESLEKWKLKDEIGQYYWRDFIRTGGNSTPNDRPKQYFPIYVSLDGNILGVGDLNKSNNAEEYYSDDILVLDEYGLEKRITLQEFRKENQFIEVLPLGSTGVKQVWRWSDREKILIACKTGEIAFFDNKIKIKDRVKEGSKPTTCWYDSEFNATSHGTFLLKKIFEGDKVFSYPKSIYTMRNIVQITTKENDIVLDFFAGSGTTGHAVLDINQKDGGDRKFILCEQMDYVETTTTERIKRILPEKDCFLTLELMKYNQKYIDLIEVTDSKDEIISIWNEMQENAFLSYQFDRKTFNERLDAFKTAPIEEMKNYLMEVLDKNQLYINYTEINDETFEVSELDKALNKQFYSLK
jgi:adenine-specific DNA-methyltransferase